MNRSILAGTVVALSAALSAPLLMATAAQAQVRPNYDAGDALREVERLKPPVEKPQQAPVIPEQEDQPFTVADGQTVLVREFRLEGGEGVDPAEVLPLLEPWRGRELTLTEIYEAAAAVTNHYRAKGFLVAKAYVPRQDASAGILTIRVVTGRIGTVGQENGTANWDFLLEGIFENAMEQGQPVTKAAVERAMLLASDLPGAQMPNIVISPGDAPGTSDFIFRTEPANRLAGYAMTDNFGSRYTGRLRTSAGLELNAPLGLGDKLTLSGMDSEHAGLLNGRAAYAFPIGFDGLRLELAAARTTYKLGDIYQSLNAIGYATSYDASLSYPLIRSRAETLSLSLKGSSRRLQDKSLGTTISDRSAQVGSATLQNQTNDTLFGMDLTTTASASVTGGYLEVPDAGERATNLAGVDSAGLYSKGNLSFSGTLTLTSDISLTGALSGQHTLRGRNLDGSEQMSISGYTGVKSYAEGVVGDNAWLANVEAKHALPGFDDFAHALGVFGDLGQVYIRTNKYSSESNGLRLADVGIGYYANYQYDTGRYLVGKIQLANTVGPQQATGERGPRSKLLASVGLTF